MFHNRGPTVARPSKATPNTQCQKCLQRGHYTYECKAAAQERPYISRPSRTQQLMNPKLMPELGKVEVPEELLRKKGVADDILKKKEDERRRERERRGGRDYYDDLDRAPRTRRRRDRSASVDSVQTISTNASRSRSPHRKRSRSPRRSRRDDDRREDRSKRHHHRRRSPSPVAARIIEDPVPRGRPAPRSVSPASHRSYSRSRSKSPLPSADPMDRLASRQSGERSLSRNRSSSPLGQRRSVDRDDDRPRTANRERSYSRERSTPPRRERDGGFSGEGSRSARSAKRNEEWDRGPAPSTKVERRDEPRRNEPARERSLSPFSKRVALTKQMGGR